MSTLASPGSQDRRHGPADLVITDVRIRFPEARSKGIVMAYATVTFNQRMVIHNVKLIEKDGKRFVSMPARRSHEGKYTDIVHPTDRDTRHYLEEEVWSAYETAHRKRRRADNGHAHNGHDDSGPGEDSYADDGDEGGGHT